MRDWLTAFIPEHCGWYKGRPAYYRKRLIHHGYQLLTKKCKNDSTDLDRIIDNYFTDSCIFILESNFDTKEELLNEVVKF